MNKTSIVYPPCINKRSLPTGFDALPNELKSLIQPSERCDQVEYATLSNGYVSPYGIVFKNGLLVKQSLYKMYPSWKNALTFYKKIFLGRVRKLSQPCLAAVNPFCTNYGHFLFESLPRIFATRELHRNLTLLIPEESPRHVIAYAEMFPFRDIVRVNQHELIHSPEVIIPNSYEFGKHHYDLMLDLKKYLIQAAGPVNILPKRVLLSRDKAAYRKSPQEKDLFNELKSSGFERIFAEDLTINEQIQVFSNTIYLLGIHSTGLNNCFFMPPQSDVLNIILKGHNDISVYNVSQISKQHFSFLLTQRMHNHPLINFDDPVLSIPDIVKHVEQTL
jgi:hypothetical protein